MHTMALSSTDDVLFIGRRVLGLLRDPRSDARRLARLVDHVPELAAAIVRRAEFLLRSDRRVTDTTHAITLIGFERLERAVRAFLRSEYARLRAAEERAEERVEAEADAPPDDRTRHTRRMLRAEVRYAAL